MEGGSTSFGFITSTDQCLISERGKLTKGNKKDNDPIKMRTLYETLWIYLPQSNRVKEVAITFPLLDSLHTFECLRSCAIKRDYKQEAQLFGQLQFSMWVFFSHLLSKCIFSSFLPILFLANLSTSTPWLSSIDDQSLIVRRYDRQFYSTPFPTTHQPTFVIFRAVMSHGSREPFFIDEQYQYQLVAYMAGYGWQLVAPAEPKLNVSLGSWTAFRWMKLVVVLIVISIWS